MNFISGRLKKGDLCGILQTKITRNTRLGYVRVLKSGSGGYGNSRNLKSRVRVCRVLKNVGFGREFSGSGIPGHITTMKRGIYQGSSKLESTSAFRKRSFNGTYRDFLLSFPLISVIRVRQFF